MIRYLPAIAAILALAPAARAATCTISATAVDFGSYDYLSPAARTSQGTISWSCDVSASISIALGPSSTGAWTPRRLSSGLNGADYNLYLDASCTTVWGDGIAPGTSAWIGSGVSMNVPVYGCVPPHQALPAGTYSDTITVTIQF